VEMAGTKTTARTTTQHPPPLLQATARRVDGGVQGPGPGSGPGRDGTGMEHTTRRGKTDNKDRTTEMRGGPTISGQGTRNGGHARERTTNKG
jgi:hypothetical protein